ncbi:uncharacterized protein LOC119094038 [Pollicipes pollicipes]|uniref:uncharacterized protein LOC119094038 n=1 Tax=Pollicipes pollicipes TaxID=41117 RepID=UPI001884B315|nr:uncharacterized protein LOC119094038 [Pollicipes pollicipes]
MRVKMPPSMRILQDSQADQGMLLLHREICCQGSADADPVGDAMTCRICQRDFDLADVIRFIHQRVLQCAPPPPATGDQGGRDTPPGARPDRDGPGLNGRRRPSGNAPRRIATSIGDREKLHLNGLSPTPSVSSTSSDGRREDGDRPKRTEEEEAKIKCRLVDACANTTESGKHRQ